MQKIINVLSLASFVVSAGVVGVGSWVYFNRYALINDVKNIAAEEITEMLPIIAQELLPSASTLPAPPELPVTQPSLPF